MDKLETVTINLTEEEVEMLFQCVMQAHDELARYYDLDGYVPDQKRARMLSEMVKLMTLASKLVTALPK